MWTKPLLSNLLNESHFMEKKCFFLLLIAPIILLTSCRSEFKSTSRSQDPWIFRSVLDNRPRMLTMALQNHLYAAYDTEQCGLYKVWQGGVQLEGVAYTNVKNLQPTSWGNTFWEDPSRTSPWSIQNGGDQKI